MVNKLQFNISPSALNVYFENEFLFYKRYIEKAKEDSATYQVYGLCGTMVHEILEDFHAGILKTEEEAQAVLTKKWDKKEISKMPTIKNHILHKSKYEGAVKNGINILQNKYDISDSELKVVLPYKNDDIAKINFKGLVDCVGIEKKTKKKIIMDYKTSSTKEAYDDDKPFSESFAASPFYRQAIFYVWLYWKENNEFIDTVIFEYVKINKESRMTFTLDDLKLFEVELHRIGAEIIEKGFKKGEYDVGDEDGIFNGYKKACIHENRYRNKDAIVLTQKLNRIYHTGLPLNLKKIMDAKYKYKKTVFIPKTKKYKYYYVKTISNTHFPAAYLNDFRKLISDYNEHYGTNYFIDLETNYDEEVINTIYKTVFRNSLLTPHYYQEDAIKAAFKYRVGIIYGGTSCLSGDTYIDLPRNLKLNPKGIKIKDLVGKKDFYVYTYNIKKRKLELNKCKDVWLTGKKQIYKIKFKSGKELICTSEHKLLTDVYDNSVQKVGIRRKLIEHEYKKLIDIKSEFDFNKNLPNHKKNKIKICSFNRCNDLKTIRIDYLNNINMNEHKFIASELHENWNKDMIVHHKDGNNKNNNIDNLITMTNSKHCSLHSSLNKNFSGSGVWLEKGHPRGMLGKHHSEIIKSNIGKNTSLALRGIEYISIIKDNAKRNELTDKRYLTDEYKINLGKKSSLGIQNKMKNPVFRNRWLEKSSENAKISYSDEIINIEDDKIIDTYDMETENNHNFVANGIIVHNCGKTLISSEIIRRLNRKTLFIVNRKELLDQTADVFEEELGVKVGRMYEGNLEIDKQITVASIQTLCAILKRKDETTKKLRMFLYNVTLTIMDECQNVSDAGMYGIVSNFLMNSIYTLGLSGSPFRNDNATLLMNKLVGMVIYSKPTKELEAEGYITPTKCIFIQNKLENKTPGAEYIQNYNESIVQNADRNKTVKSIVEKFRKDKKILILTKSVEHGEILHKLIDKSLLINGSTEKHLRKVMFADFKKYPGYTLIGSNQIFSTGIDVPDLDIIINTTANKSKVEVIQTVGRVKRKHMSKAFGYYIDFCDLFNPTFQRGAEERQKILKKYGNEVKIIKFEA